MTSKHAQAPVLISQGVFDSVKTFRDFEQRVSALFDTNTKAQGDAFEIFVEAYLATQPILQCQETWLVGDIPVEIREALNLPNDSKGIDGVYKSMLDDYVPYQVKFRSNRPALGFNEVAPFLGITEKATDRLLITNCDTIAIDVQNRTGIRSLRGVDFDQLTDEDFTVIENWLKQKPKKRQPLKPDPYQDEALTNIANHLEANDRGTVVMACGTGKTLVALWAVEQSKAKSILVLVPSLTLMKQTLKEWSDHNSWEKDFSYLCVCSDPTVNLKNEDQIEIDPSDVPFRIDTDPEIVRRYLAQANKKLKIIFSTYQSSQVVSQATKGEFEFDVAIFDEAHKTTGLGKNRSTVALKDENIKIKKRLFLTATPKLYNIKKRDKNGELEFTSMDDEAVYGKRAHTLTFGEAASKGIICPYKVVITLIDKQQVDDFALKNGITLVEGDSVKAKWVASQIAVSSSVKHTNATKIITFHSRVKTAREFASDEVYGIKQFIDDFNVFHVHGKQKSNDREDIISKFRNSTRSLITNAKCLTEGVDVPAVDMVVFVDPRHSKIDIAQAVGRAMRKPRGSDKKVGYIVVPIFAEDASEQSVEEAIKRENFDDVALVLSALLEQDEELAEIIRELKQSKGRGESFNPKKFKEKIEVIGPLIGLDELTNSIYIEVVHKLGESWDEWYGRLTQEIKRKGHCYFNKEYTSIEGFKIGQWMSYIRTNKKLLSERKTSLLNNIEGWSWNYRDSKWEKHIDLVLKYIEKNKDSRIPADFIDNESKIKVGRWLASVRTRKHQLSIDRIKFLENLPNWSWSPLNDDWLFGLERLKIYQQNNNSTLFKDNFIDDSGFGLGKWAQRQRAFKDILSEEQICKLENIPSWSWLSLTEQYWNIGYKHLVSYHSIFGNVQVKQSYVMTDGYALGNWVQLQRQNKKNNSISVEKIALIEKFEDWKWDVNEEGQDFVISKLKDFYNEFNHTDVPTKYITPDGYKLGEWVVKTRYKNGSNLSEEHRNFLESLNGWRWEKLDKWNINFNNLKKLLNLYPLRSITKNKVTSPDAKLGSWIIIQKNKKELLSTDKVYKLESLTGWTWDSYETLWLDGYNALKNYITNNHIKELSSVYVDRNNYKLGYWVFQQRRLKNKDKLSFERIKMLEAINGWFW